MYILLILTLKLIVTFNSKIVDDYNFLLVPTLKTTL